MRHIGQTYEYIRTNRGKKRGNHVKVKGLDTIVLPMRHLGENKLTWLSEEELAGRVVPTNASRLSEIGALGWKLLDCEDFGLAKEAEP